MRGYKAEPKMYTQTKNKRCAAQWSQLCVANCWGRVVIFIQWQTLKNVWELIVYEYSENGKFIMNNIKVSVNFLPTN